jgi:hypothetical protein
MIYRSVFCVFHAGVHCAARGAPQGMPVIKNSRRSCSTAVELLD